MADIKLISAYKRYDTESVLNGVSIHVNNGEYISLIGASGCGKTTTLKIIAGLIKACSGQVLFNNVNASKLSENKSRAVIVDQNVLLFPHMTVERNINFGLRIRRVSKEKIKEKTEKLLEMIQLSEHKNKFPSELSGGQMQRVAIARAMAIEPEVLLLDEPFSKLDVSLREDMRKFIKEVHENHKITIIMVTHDKEEAFLMSDRVAFMDNGKIEQYDTPENIYKRPNSMKVARFFGHCNFIEGTIENSVFTSKLGTYSVDEKKEGKVTMLIRSEQIKIVREGEQNATGIVTDYRYAGEKSYLKLDSNGVTLGIHTTEDIKYRLRDTIHIKIDYKKGVLLW
ncbi:MAG: ABC transporter ATP-binding protein [Alkaliphilus sp.]|nr:MAG: ABC transporter ATP-binding protein [Alkaliphilus sp.]